MTNLKNTRIYRLFQSMRIRTQLALLILATGFLCFSLFQFMWMHKWNVWEFLSQNSSLFLDIFPDLDEDFWKKLRQEALKYDVPESEEDADAVVALQPFFDTLADEYTGIYIYGLEDGTYRAGAIPTIMLSDQFRFTFDSFYQWTDGTGEMGYEFPIKFKNEYAQVLVYFYHRTRFVAPYFIFCLIFSVVLFFAVILFFINKKMKSVILLQKNILQMASGDLNTPVPAMGQDEIGILAHELDGLRLALKETIVQEQESHKANQDLVAALSHDLRTPLTIIKGYLEILKRNPNPDMHGKYIDQCLQKTDDIKEMTDRIFEYALVYEDTETPELSQLPAEILMQHLTENVDFLHLTGFHTKFHPTETADATFSGDKAMIKRVFNNLFSNIIKYGDKKEPVVITVALEEKITVEKTEFTKTAGNTGSSKNPAAKYHIKVVLVNTVKSDYSKICSTQIGLKSVRKMMELMNGKLETENDGIHFAVTLLFPCC